MSPYSTHMPRDNPVDEEAAKREELERALQEGIDSPDFVGDPFAAAYAAIGWHPRDKPNRRKS